MADHLKVLGHPLETTRTNVAEVPEGNSTVGQRHYSFSGHCGGKVNAGYSSKYQKCQLHDIAEVNNIQVFAIEMSDLLVALE